MGLSQVHLFHRPMNPFTFPRSSQIGTTDDGKIIAQSPCPNCSGPNYRQTVSTEYCPDCTLAFDYWNSPHGNTVYDTYLARKHAAEEAHERERALESPYWE